MAVRLLEDLGLVDLVDVVLHAERVQAEAQPELAEEDCLVAELRAPEADTIVGRARHLQPVKVKRLFGLRAGEGRYSQDGQHRERGHPPLPATAIDPRNHRSVSKLRLPRNGRTSTAE